MIFVFFVGPKLGVQKFRMNLKKQKEQNEREERSRSLITPQDGRMYGGEEATDFYTGGNVQFPTHDINNIPQPCVHQQPNTNLNFTTQLVSPLGHHHHHHLGDRVSVAVSGRNLVMTHHHHQTSELACIENTEESLGYNNFEMYNEDEAAVGNFTCWFTQNSQEVDFSHFHEPVMPTTTMIPNHHHPSPSLQVNQQQMMNVHVTEPSMLHVPLFPSSYTHSSFLDQVMRLMFLMIHMILN